MYIKVFVKTFGIAFYVTIVCLLFSYPFVYAISQTIQNKVIKDFLLIKTMKKITNNFSSERNKLVKRNKFNE